MRVLWVSNSPIGPAAQILNDKYQGSSGGWIQSEFESLNKNDMQMYFLCSQGNINETTYIHKAGKIGEVYCVKAPRIANGIKNPTYLVNQIEEIINIISPDIIQIWGTETCISNIVANTVCAAKKVIFIQGLIGVHERYLDGYFSKKNNKHLFRDVTLNATLRSILRKRQFRRQVQIEKDTIKKCGNVIVDSDFAEAYCSSIDKNVKCYRHVLMPNDIFYKYKWSIENIERNTIFTVFGSSSEKGVQQLLRAVAIIKADYPTIRVKIPGPFSLTENGVLVPSKKSEYESVLNNLICELDLKQNIQFLGKLDVEGMAKNINSSHIFVNPSCMEVHALSLREAMIQGVPCISSLCGGTGELIRNKINGFVYRYEEYETLAFYINKLLCDDLLAQKISNEATNALNEFASCNNQSLIEIYTQILR